MGFLKLIIRLTLAVFVYYFSTTDVFAKIGAALISRHVTIVMLILVLLPVAILWSWKAGRNLATKTWEKYSLKTIFLLGLIGFVAFFVAMYLFWQFFSHTAFGRNCIQECKEFYEEVVYFVKLLADYIKNIGKR